MTISLKSKALSGMTLVEVLIALSLLSLLLSMLYGALYNMTQVSQAAAERNSRSEEIDSALRFIFNQLSQIVPLSERTEDGLFIFFEGRSDRLTYTGTLPAHRGGGGLHFMQLGLEENLQSISLWDKQARPGQAMNESAIQTTWRRNDLLEHVEALSFEYFGVDQTSNNPRWHNIWEGTSSLPRLIKVHIRMHEGGALPPFTVELHRLNVASQPQWVW
ncbi:MAG: hypothetical protein COA71_12710 [SAR86 cluster bacterium]|uniref:Type II secretion system protein J n=1 Tax=SAR86 cluster bacterium TaxID=2030880 RepID=A0A2A5C8E7_9GAMM|nr:MAG: hypothetical protein COA71_12710 [SAR86 cluster bacterium]